MNELEKQNFTIYKNGYVDRLFEIEKLAGRILHGLGHVAYVGLETTVNVVDELVTEYQKL